MRIITWNVNSIRARHERLVALLERHRPDVLCLQELKCELPVLESLDLEQHGYHVAASCQRTYNGVAILSRQPLEDVQIGLQDDVDDPQARLIAATAEGVRILCAYMPNGSTVGSDKYAYKLDWMERMHRYLETRCDPAQPLVLGGDFNVAPDERDVHDPELWREETLFHEDSVAAYEKFLAWGLHDSFRVHEQGAGFYSWWDYRMLGFPKNRGLRIDLLLVTQPLLPRVAASFIDREERKGKQPSDHAPVVLDLK